MFSYEIIIAQIAQNQTGKRRINYPIHPILNLFKMPLFLDNIQILLFVKGVPTGK